MSPSTLKQSLGGHVPVSLLGEILDMAPSPRMDGLVPPRSTSRVYTTPPLGEKGDSGSPPITGSVGRMAGQGPYEINLTFEGQLVRHQVTPDMRVIKLREDAAEIYRLVSQDLVMVLFGMNPQTLSLHGQLSDPPPVEPESTVMIFNMRGAG